MITIHGRQTSSNVQVVMCALGEMGLPHERLDVGGHFGGNTTPEYLELNPMGRVPLMQDGALTLFESHAILRYLCSKPEGHSLWPQDATARAKIDQWMEWSKVNFYPVLTYKVFWQLVRENSTTRNYALVAEGVAELARLLQIAEAQIAKSGWLAGDHFSLADIAFGTHLYRYFNTEFEKHDFPHIAAYYETLCERPAYQAHAMISFNSLRVSDD